MTVGHPVVLRCSAAVIITVVGTRRLADALASNIRFDLVDFGVFYRAAACLVSRCDPYAIPQGMTSPNLAPPHVLLLFLPLQGWSIQSAYYIWLAINAAALGFCALRIARELDLTHSWSVALLAAAVVASSGLAMGSVASGNYYPLLTIPLTFAWVAWRRGRLTVTARWLGAAAACKVLLLLPLVWFAIQREHRAALAMTSTWLVIFVVGLLTLGIDVYAGWLVILARAPMAGQFHDAAIMQAALRAFTETSLYAPIMPAPALVRPIWAVLAGLLVTATVIVRRDPDRALLTLIAAAILVAPIGWVFGCWWLAGPAVAVWVTGTTWARLALACGAVALWLPDTTPLWGQPSPWLTLTTGSLYLWVAVALWTAGVIPRNAA